MEIMKKDEREFILANGAKVLTSNPKIIKWLEEEVIKKQPTWNNFNTQK